MQFLHIPNSDKRVAFYSLDVVISVGYRVKSLRGTQFRVWASSVLKEYLKKGFAINDELLKNADNGKYFLTNDSYYWNKPKNDTAGYTAFSVHHGAVKEGTMSWGVSMGEGTTRGRDKALVLNLQGPTATVYSKCIGMLLRNAARTRYDYSKRSKSELFIE